MQRGCTAVHGVVTEGIWLEYPVSLGENFENAGFGMFSNIEQLARARFLARLKHPSAELQMTVGGPFRGIAEFHGMSRGASFYASQYVTP
jgi:hypothetical protein